MTGLRHDRPLRILHVPNDLGGHPRALAVAQRALGHDAVCLSLSYSPLGFNADENFDAPLGSRGRLARREAARFSLLWRSVRWADVIHCHFGQTLLSVRAQPVADVSQVGLVERLTVAYARALWLRDLPLWRMAGKRVAMSFYGDDVRMVDASLERNPHTHLALPGLQDEFTRRDALKRRMVETLTRNGVTMFATNPDLLLWLPEDARFLPYGNVDPAAFVPTPPREGGALRLIHMPTHRDVKGTSLFVAAVDQLRQEGLDCSLTIVEGRENAEALAELVEHDVLLDQLRVGWFGAAAVEAMAMAKPAVAYLHPEDLARAPADYTAALPIIQADPACVTEALRKLVLTPRAELAAIGRSSRRFVEDWHSPEGVAKMTIAAYFDAA